MLYRVKEKIRNIIIRLFMSKRNDIEKLAEFKYDATDCEKKNIINSSIIVRYQKDDEIKYFRECKKHYSLKKYLLLAIDDYFDNICKFENKEQLRKDVLTNISLKSNYKKLINLGGVFNTNLLNILAGVFCDYQLVGLPCFSNYTNEQFISFIQYVNCVLINQRINGYVRKGECENNSANKQLATYELSKCLGVERLIPKVYVCKLIDMDVRIGTLMDNALGFPPSEILPEQRRNFEKSTFLRDITTLEYFDAICYQLDHRLDNYNVVEENEKITKVVAFDNDANRTFFVSGKLPKKTYAGASCVVGAKRKINRPCIDGEFAKTILSVSKRNIFDSVDKYMSRWQLNALWKRIKLLKTAIIKATKENQEFLVEDWNNIDIDVLADYKYGNTYFNLYLNDTLMLDRKVQFDQMKK